MFDDRPQVEELSGRRLRLSHGPIDVVLRGWGEPAAVDAAYRAAARRFGGILPELTLWLGPRINSSASLQENAPHWTAKADRAAAEGMSP